tara:strand:+ start:129 stop:509 length:381 start_codon:yes stop_codon:yes gene_type:complete
MSHFARVENNIVKEVIRAEKDFVDNLVYEKAGKWIQTSFNTHGNEHKLGGTPLRANFAGIGFHYDYKNDVFYAPKPENGTTYILNTDTYLWERPIAQPDKNKKYFWNEEIYQNDNTKGWVEKTQSE